MSPSERNHDVLLTQYSHGGGWGCKLGPEDLDQILQDIPPLHRNLLIGFEDNDDAAVIQLRDDLALVQSLDFFMPIVDNPFHFGQIARI